jgi:hypothetical protein
LYDLERAKLYRQRAAELLNSAEHTKDPIQHRMMLAIAAMYHRLAGEFERDDKES